MAVVPGLIKTRWGWSNVLNVNKMGVVQCVNLKQDGVVQCVNLKQDGGGAMC